MTFEPGPPSDSAAGQLLGLLREAQRKAPTGAATTVLALDGPSGAGKTTLADQLVALLEEADPGTTALVRMENLYPGWDGLEAAIGILATEVLPPLLRGEPARYGRWDWTRDQYGTNDDVIPPRPVTIVEGVGSGALAAASSVSALAVLEAPGKVRHARAMARDGDTYQAHWDRWAAQEQAYFQRDDPGERAGLWLLTGFFQAPGLR